MDELLNLLTLYLVGWKTIYDCAEWLAGIDWGTPGIEQESLKFIGRAELLITEALEGQRSEDDFRREATDYVGRKTGTYYIIPDSPLVVSGSCNTTIYQAFKNSDGG